MSTIIHAGLSDVGLVRQENEDRWFADADQGLYLVADGIGGAHVGGLAAQVVVEVLPRLLRQKLEGVEQLEDPMAIQQVVAALAELSNQLRNKSKAKFGLAGTGSTAVLALVGGTHAVVAHMGDSRAYLLRGKRLKQLTKDHSLTQLLLNCGEITADEAADHPARGQLTRFVGMPDEPLPEARLVKLSPNDRLLLCSDGLTDMLNDKKLLSILRKRRTPEDVCGRLLAAANKAGGKDNITVVIVAVSKAPK